MDTIENIKNRAESLSEETKIDGIPPARVGGIIYDLADYAFAVQVNGASLGIKSTYKSVSLMEADSTSPVDTKGRPLRYGNLVCIYDQENPNSDDSGKVYAFQDPGWVYVTQIDAMYATRQELADLKKSVEENVVAIDLQENGKLVARCYADNSALTDATIRDNGKIVLTFNY